MPLGSASADGSSVRTSIGLEIDFIRAGTESRSGQAIALRFGDLSGPRDSQTVVILDGGFADTGTELVAHVKKYYGTDVVDLVVSLRAPPRKRQFRTDSEPHAQRDAHALAMSGPCSAARIVSIVCGSERP